MDEVRSYAQKSAQEAAKKLNLPQRLHHYAFVIRDQEANRHFVEDLIGMPLVATWCEKGPYGGLLHDVAYCHTFYALADGGAIAFFQFAEEAIYEQMESARPKASAIHHIALKVDKAAYDGIEKRLNAANYPIRQVDHGYCQSMYVSSPEGFRLEFTVDADDVEKINEIRLADAHSELKRWLKGDHTPNNQLHHRN